MPSDIEISGPSHLQELKERVGQSFDHFYDRIGRHHHSVSGHVAVDFEPSADVSESDIGLQISVELPGMDPSDIEILVRDGAIIVRGERETEHRREDRTYVRRECLYGRFSRSFGLANDLDAEKAEATYRNGVLVISVPLKPKAQGRTQKIEISGS